MWRFLDKIDQIYEENPSVNPPFLIDSSTDEDPHDQICTSDKSDEDVADDEHHKEHAGVYLPSMLLPRFVLCKHFLEFDPIWKINA